MKKRKMTNRKKDKAVFAKTARNLKEINYSTVSYRGGIRL